MIRNIALAGLALLAVSCGPQPDRGIQGGAQVPDSLRRVPRTGGRVVIGVQQEPEMLSEILNAMATNNMVCNLVFSKFVKYDDDLNLIPDLIKEIPSVENGGISPDYLTYTYHLRTDALWHDGRRVTSRDVAFTFRVIMDPKVNVESREGWDIVRSVETPDDSTVVFHLIRHYPDFTGEAFFDESILPEHILRDETGEMFHSSRFHHAPVGSGPFRFKQWVPGSHLVLVANEHYYGEGPYLDEIVFKFIPNENALLIQLKTGEIDIFDNANINFIEQLEQVPGIVVYKTPVLMYEHVDFNMENPILRDKLVRQALSYATNKKEIAERIYNGLVTVAPLDEFPSSKYFHRDVADRVVYDPLVSRKLLREAGWWDVNGDGILDKGGEPLKLQITASAGQLDRERTELVLREQWRQVGVDLEIRNYNPTVLYGTYEDGGILKRGKYDVAMYAWLSSPEPATKEALYSSKNIPPSGQNNPRIDHDELTALLQRGSTEVDHDRRVQIYRRISEILVEEVPVVPLFWYTSIDPCTEKLENFRPNPTQSADTWNANVWYRTDRPQPPQAARRRPPPGARP
jgi:peptide/nickel transport system substrate-binding protein